MKSAERSPGERPELTANAIKNRIMHYYRFKRGYPYVATECWDCDVIASDGKSLLEFEVKISWADYKREFAKEKHCVCPGVYFLTSKGITPNRRYFAAPKELADRISADVAERHPAYGVISVCDYWGPTVLRRAAVIHKDPVSDEALRDIVMRISSELITVRGKVRNV